MVVCSDEPAHKEARMDGYQLDQVASMTNVIADTVKWMQ